MLKIAVVGAGYVGLVTAACFAEVGNIVICCDIDSTKIQQLENGSLPLYEPGLAELIQRVVAEGRLRFTSDLQETVENAEVVFIAVGTPSALDGSVDISDVNTVAQSIGKLMLEPIVIVNKSTVPVGTAKTVRSVVQTELDERGLALRFSVVSNPEFLKEGVAISDFMKPDRIVVGSDTAEGLAVMRLLYAPFQRNKPCLIEMDSASVELSKYAANAMLANRISFMNEMALLAEHVGADIESIRAAIGSDPRIGTDFLYAGCGYGGSCFPKDVRALRQMGAKYGCEMPLVEAIERVNEAQKLLLFNRVMAKFGGNVAKMDFAVWGLTFKPDTDDLRESPSVPLIKSLLDNGARVRAFDPLANQQSNELFSNCQGFATYDDMYIMLEGCAALILVTEWKQFRSPDFSIIKRSLRYPLLFDGRNQWDPILVRDLGFEYMGIGRP